MINEELACRSYRDTHALTHTHTHTHIHETYTMYTCTQSSDRRRFDEEKGLPSRYARIFLPEICRRDTLTFISNDNEIIAYLIQIPGCDMRITCYISSLPVSIALHDRPREWHSLRSRDISMRGFFTFDCSPYTSLYKCHQSQSCDLKLIKIRYILRNCWSLHTLVCSSLYF